VIDPRLRNKKSESSAKFSCETLENREALYKRAAEVIGSAKSILDTTWGPEPSEPSPNARWDYGAQDELAFSPYLILQGE
jgi:hypothetical protein